jgi:hypothetical protein
MAQPHPFIPGAECMGLGVVTMRPVAEKSEKSKKPRIRVAALGSRADDLVDALDKLAAKVRAAAKSS